MAFNMFPFSNLHDLNLDWVLRTIKAAVETVQTFAARLTQAESDIQDLETSRVSYAESQTLTSTQKARARNNIGAASAADLTALGVRVAGDEDLISTKMDQREPRGDGALIMSGWYDEQAGESHVPVLAIRNRTSKQTSFLPGLHGDDGLLIQAGDLTAGTTGPAYLEGIKTPVRDDQAANKEYVDSKMPLVVHFTGDVTNSTGTCDKSYSEILAAWPNVIMLARPGNDRGYGFAILTDFSTNPVDPYVGFRLPYGDENDYYGNIYQNGTITFDAW